MVMSKGGDDIAGAGRLCCNDREEADRAAAQNDHTFANREVCEMQSMHGDRQRLNKRSELEIKPTRQRVEGVRGDGDVLSQSAGCECAEKHVFRAQVIAPGSAES